MKLFPSVDDCLKLMVMLGFYFSLVHTASKQSEKSAFSLDQFVVCNDTNDAVWCMALGKERNVAFEACMDSCSTVTKIETFPEHKSIVVRVKENGQSALMQTCLLNCFFSQEAALYRKNLVQTESVLGFFADSINCKDDKNMAYCTAPDEKRGKKLTNCLKKDQSVDLMFSPRDKSVFLVTSKQFIRKTKQFVHCFFQEETAIALRRVDRIGLLSFLERDKFPGYEVGPLAQMKANAL